MEVATEKEEAPSPPTPDAWVRVALRHPGTGEFLARESGVQVYRSAAPFGAMAWDDANSMALWMAARPAYIRRRLADEGWLAVRLTAAATPASPAPTPAVVDDTLGRPAVAQAAGFQ